MINNRQNGRRGRGRNNGPRPQGGVARPEQGNRIDNRARGNASQLHEKYKTLARDTQMAGDRVLTEYYLQFADHYFRVLSETRSRFDEQRPVRQDGRDGDGDEYDGDDADGDIVDERPAPRRDERPREEGRRDEPRRDERPREDGRREPRYEDRPREDRPREEARRDERPRDERPREDGRREEGRREDGRREEGTRDEVRRDERPREDARRDEPRFERAERRDRYERAPRAEPIAAAEPATAQPLGEIAEPAEALAPRPRRGRPPRVVAPVEQDAEPRFDIAVLPPSIAPVEAAVEEGEAPRRVRRVRRPRAESGETDSGGDVAA